MSNMVVPTPSHQETQGPDAGPDQDLLKASTTPVAASSTEEQAISHSVQEETRPALRAEATAEQTTTPTNTQKPEPTTAASEMAITPVPAQTQAPKQVFSLFLTPEQRKKKLEAEGLSTVALSKRGRKPKPKGPTGIAAPPSPHSMITSKPSIDPKSIVDPNISKNGETHPFFQEIKATSQLHVTSSASSSGSDAANGHHANTRRWLNDKPQESPFPLRHQQFHGSETIDVINGVVARLCGINASSPTAPASTVETLHEIAKRSSGNTEHKLCGWYSLRASPDLGITAPQYTVKPRGKDCWTHWGRSTGADTDREQKWRAWSERNHRLQKPTERERQLVSPRNSGASPAEEFESCQRVAANQDLWQRTWATTLLSNARLTPGLESTATDVQLPAADLARVGELWTEKYRPHQGAEVLGNRANTEYLTQWLKGLEVSGWTLNPEEAGAGGNGMAKKTADIIMGTARKRRKRPRRRGGPELDDFIVYDDDDDFESPYDYLSDEDDGFFAAPKPLSSFSRLAYSDTPESAHSGRTLPKKVDIKSNTVLLSGPTGSCKTAAVYACAEESGYEVFEVSPGTRRTGKEVLGLVGEMAENHHVHVVPGKSDVKDDVVSIMGGKSHESPVATPAATPVATSTIQAFFQRSQQNQASQRQQQQQRQQQHQEMSENGDDEYMDESSDVDIDDSDGRHSPAAPPNDTQRTTRSSSSFSSSSVADGGKSSSPAFHEDTLSDLYSLLSTTNPRQSLILLEEVDILFEDDKGFWASIMTLLSKSRRPVVMTCNDVSKIPAESLRFQEHLEFTRPCLRELHQYLSSVCRIEGFICSSEYILGLIKHCRYDVRKCLMQLQYDAGVIRSKPALSRSSSGILSANRSTTPVPVSPSNPVNNHGDGLQNGNRTGNGAGSPARKKPQRLLRISAKGIVPASAPVGLMDRKVGLNPKQELERLDVQAQYAEMMSLCDSGLRMKPARVIQYYEADQFEASKDDVVGQHFSVYKRPSGADHLLLDQEIACLVEEGSESLYMSLAEEQGMSPTFSFEDTIKKDDPAQSLSKNFVPQNDAMARNVQNMQPALEQTLSLHGLRFNLDTTFEIYAPLLRSMIHAEAINTVIPTGKRTMRSGGHLRRHLNRLSDSERGLMLATAFSLPLSSLSSP